MCLTAGKVRLNNIYIIYKSRANRGYSKSSFDCLKLKVYINSANLKSRIDDPMKEDLSFGTRCVHAGEGPSPEFKAHTTPIYQTSTFLFDSAEQAEAVFSGKEPGYRYVRSPPNTPTHAAFIEKMKSLEGGEAGLSFSSGMAAETAVVLSQLKSGDHLFPQASCMEAPTVCSPPFCRSSELK